MEASASIKKEPGVETANICRLCLSSGDALEAPTYDESAQYKVLKNFDFTDLQIEFSPGVSSYLCKMCEARLIKIDAEQTVGTNLSIKTEVTSPDAAKDLHFNRKCCSVHQANMTYECCGHIPVDLFEAEENPLVIKSEHEDVDEQHPLQTANDVFLNAVEQRIKTEVTSPDAAKDLHLNRKCFSVHQANMTYECCGHIPDDLFEAEENPLVIKSEHEDVDEQHPLQAANEVLDHEQNNNNTEPLGSICQDQKYHPVTVANNTCADDSAAESIQNVLDPGTRNAHSKSHSTNHKHHCPHCSATYPALHKLQIHIRTHTGEKPYKCTVCSKIFHSSQKLAEHSRIHNKAHQCPYCPSRFTMLCILKIHLRTHTGEKPYLCKICDKAFHSPTHLAVHSKIHNNDRRHQCPHCLAMFTRSFALKIHIRTHTDEKPYQCQVCGKAYRSPSGLAYHSRIHTMDETH